MTRAALSLLFRAAALAALVAVVPAQSEDGSCCSEAASEGRLCDHTAPVELPPLPDGASVKERRLRAVHERALASPSPLLGRSALDQAREELARLDPELEPRRASEALWVAAHYAMAAGDVLGAIADFEQLSALFEERVDVTSEARAEVLYQLGLAYFRLAERQNCIAHHNQDSCIFPLSAAAVHPEPEGAQKALATFERVLAADRTRVDAVWLMNVAHMALGTWPDGVREEYRLPSERFDSERQLGRFLDVAPDLGVNRLARAGGALLDDFDGDGWLDVLTSTMDTGKSLVFFRNAGDGTFEDRTVPAGLANQLGGIGLAHGDLDGDGRLDVLVLRGGEVGSEGEMPESLLRQTAPGVFEDVTVAAGIEGEAPARAAAIADVDRDGDLDVFLGYESEVFTGSVRWPSKLLRNDLGEDGLRFTDVGAEAGFVDGGACVGAAFGDLDGDGYPELYVSNRNRKNALYENRTGANGGKWTLVDRAVERGVTEPRNSRATWFFDYDNDGDLDLFVAQHGYAFREKVVATWYKDGVPGPEFPRLYENSGTGELKDVSVERGLERSIYALSANFGDVDGDGWQDVYFGTGALEMSALWPNVLLCNDGGRRFVDATRSAGLGHLQKGQAIAFGDVDADGDQDILLQTGGFYPDDGFWDALFLNPGHRTRWLTVRLAGAGTNRFGVGARVRARVAEGEVVRDVYGFVGSTSSTGGNSLQQELGLGRAERIVELEVRWPSGLVQRFEDVPLDSLERAEEGRDELVVLPSAPVRLHESALSADELAGMTAGEPIPPSKSAVRGSSAAAAD